MSIDLSLILFALVAALSPTAFAATLAVIGAGRWKALAFMAAFVSSQFLVGAILVAIGGWTVPTREHGHPTVRAYLDLAFAAWMLWLAYRLRRRPPTPAPHSSPRTKAVLERLGRVHVGTALVAGLLLGIGGPKRLVLTALAAAAIAAPQTGASEEAVKLAVYTIIATVLVWAPVIAFEVFGDRALQTVGAIGNWVNLRQRKALLVVLLVLAAIALADAVSILF